VTTQPAAPTSAPGTPAVIVRPGTALPATTMQELASVIDKTVRRERLRRRTTIGILLAVSALAIVQAGLTVVPETELARAVAVVAVYFAAPLLASLLWGTRNRALVDSAAAHAAVPASVLVRAVRISQRDGVGASTALRTALAPRAAPGAALSSQKDT
jgi:hypothetical protein